jgi:hypothetical protein
MAAEFDQHPNFPLNAVTFEKVAETVFTGFKKPEQRYLKRCRNVTTTTVVKDVSGTNQWCR